MSSKSSAFVDANLLIYLNTVTEEEDHKKLKEFLVQLIKNYILFTDILVLDEALYVSKKKYGIPYDRTLSLLKRIMMFIELIPLDEKVYLELERILKEYNLKPSDAIHLAAMKVKGDKDDNLRGHRLRQGSLGEEGLAPIALIVLKDSCKWLIAIYCVATQ